MGTLFETGLPASGTLTLQCCGQCRQVNYPPRELCGNCLADDLQWQPVVDTGIVQSQAQLHYSLEPAYTSHMPWTVASIKLDCGPVVLAHLQPGIATGAAVKLRVIQDGAGNRMLMATGTDPDTQQASINWMSTVDFKEVSA
jgi:uncharacterized OB-fold protein